MQINVTGEYNEKLKIRFSQGIWKNTLYTLFENSTAVKVAFPNDPGLFRLSIYYDSENFYLENLLYISNPNLDVLSFHFYKENVRVFCKIESKLVVELNKEILLNPLSENFKELKDIIENFDADNCASL
ncbi:hypothetical protein HYN48_13510 [Flavobacterium magnum]|uniref:Uncharacterized protein n=1 Tax=Flavobacterium magnum TaxID=2162713 RepID=A0A2S0RGF5_9FLAO|nr:hypothetical protein [Flavobacterium magnum]AWA31017.1 hypothetical protein HYN48_13510 [Flavobacterium magnum]